LYNDKEDSSSVNSDATDVDNSSALVSRTTEQLHDSDDDAVKRKSAKEFDVISSLEPTGLQNQLKTSSDINLITSGCDLEDKRLYPIKQPLGYTR